MKGQKGPTAKDHKIGNSIQLEGCCIAQASPALGPSRLSATVLPEYGAQSDTPSPCKPVHCTAQSNAIEHLKR